MSVEKTDQEIFDEITQFEPQDQESEEIANRVITEFVIMQNARDQQYKQFRNRSIGEYIDDAQKRFNYYKKCYPCGRKQQKKIRDK